MSEPFIGQISIFGFNFAPLNWALCQGQILPIQQNTALFSLLGNNFGGNGTSNFGLPNLQGNVAIGTGSAPGGSTYTMGQTGGAYNVGLNTAQSASHKHALMASPADATKNAAVGSVLAKPVGPGLQKRAAGKIYNPNTPNTAIVAPVGPAGGNAPHNNLQPYLVLNYCICLYGTFPTRP